jgi:hypothetical protein
MEQWSYLEQATVQADFDKLFTAHTQHLESEHLFWLFSLYYIKTLAGIAQSV